MTSGESIFCFFSFFFFNLLLNFIRNALIDLYNGEKYELNLSNGLFLSLEPKATFSTLLTDRHVELGITNVA